jgi:hypothetical protein
MKLTPNARAVFRDQAAGAGRDPLLPARRFYEMFFEDAEGGTAAGPGADGAEQGQEHETPMCGVPYHAADGYIAKLIRHGLRVAICDQTGRGRARAGAAGDRRIVTPGTATESSIVGARTVTWWRSCRARTSGRDLSGRIHGRLLRDHLSLQATPGLRRPGPLRASGGRRPARSKERRLTIPVTQVGLRSSRPAARTNTCPKTSGLNRCAAGLDADDVRIGAAVARSVRQRQPPQTARSRPIAARRQRLRNFL